MVQHNGLDLRKKLRISALSFYDVGVKRYFDPYDTRIASHFMLSQS